MTNKRANFIADQTKLLLVLFVTLLFVSGIILATSTEPWAALHGFFIGPLTTLRRFGSIIEAACPLMFTGLAVSIIFRAGQFSMISEGAFFIGILGSMMAGLSIKLPPIIHPALALLIAALMGAVAAAIPAILKMKWGASEVVTSLMLNYVLRFLAIYVVSYHYREMSISSLASWKLPDTVRLSKIVPGTNMHTGILMALLLCLALWWFLFRSRSGFYFRVTGDNPSFARYVGINAPFAMLSAQIIAGAVAGFGGGVEMLGMYTRFKWTASTGHGWTGIVIALLAKKNPLYVPFAALFIGYIKAGADVMARTSDVSSDVAQVIQGVIMILIAAEALLANLRQRLIVKASQDEAAMLAAAKGGN